MSPDSIPVALLHGAGYAGGELIRLLNGHPHFNLVGVTSRSAAGQPVWHVHPALRGQTDLAFTDPDALDLGGVASVLIAAEHRQSVAVVQALLADGYAGGIVDLSADFRFRDPAIYPKWYAYTHPAPGLLSEFVYGLPEVNAPYAPGTRYIANPGCFATALSLALWPLAQRLDGAEVTVTAFTGASGSGTRPKTTTHYPTRDGNVRAYKVLEHQHLPEVLEVLGGRMEVAFVPVSGPWTRGIWGTAQVRLPAGADAESVGAWYEEAYGGQAFVRTWPGVLPELRYAVGTPFCDLGWVVQGPHLVVGFAIDNLLKGAASQAIQNLNRLHGLPDTTGLVAAAHEQTSIDR